MSKPTVRTYLGTRGDSGWTSCARFDCLREHAEHHDDGETAMLCPDQPLTPLTEGRILSPLVTDANWHAIRRHRERHCVCPMTPAHWDVVNLCDRALRDYADHDAWQRVVEQIGGGQ